MKIRALKKVRILAVTALLILLAALLLIAKPVNSKAYTESSSLAQLSSFQIQTSILSEMSEEECIEFIIENGIEIPDELIDLPELGCIVKNIIQAVETDPNYTFVINYDITLNFAEDIKSLVNSYYSAEQGTAQVYSVAASAPYELRNSEVYGPWDDSYLNYNCYAYAIERTEYPPQYETKKQYQPGDISNTEFDYDLSIYEMVLVVKNDLTALGYDDIFITDTIPNLQPWQKLICMRKGGGVGGPDYHFMKYHPDV